MATSDPAYMGRGSTIGIGVEATWGTAVARTNWLRLLSCSLSRTQAYADRPHLGTSGETSANPRASFAGQEDAGGDIEWLGAYDDSTVLLLKNALGAAADAGAGPYTHTLTLAKDLGEGLTIEHIRGEIVDGTAISEVFEGCMISSLELTWRPGEIMRCRASVIAETAAARGAAGAPTYSSLGEPIIGWQGSTFTWNAVARKLRSLSITVDNALDRRPRLGSKYTERPQRTGPTSVTARLTLEIITGDAIYSSYLANTQSDGTITFTSGAKSLAITLQNAEIHSVSDPINTAGVLTQDIEIRCYSDGTDEGLKLVFTNASALYSAN